MIIFKQIGKVLGEIIAFAIFLCLVVVTAPIVILKVAFRTIKEAFNKYSDLYNGGR